MDGLDPDTGMIRANMLVHVIYDGTNMVLINTANKATDSQAAVGTNDINFITPAQLKNDNLNFGTGADGDVIISGNTTLVADMNYHNLTINNGVVLSPAGYRIFVRGTLLNNGTIARNGNN